MFLDILWGLPTVSSIGSIILKIILLVLVLGVIILVHEFGHFIWAKKFGVHIYEFSIGMGPIMHSHKGKDNIDYNIRWIPIGGFVSMAGEVYDDDDKVKKSDLLCNKPWWQRLIILCAGVFNNFVLAIAFLIIYAAIWGGGIITPKVGYLDEGSPAAEKLKVNDTILKINGYRTASWDKAQIILYYKNADEFYSFEVKHEDGTIETIKIKPNVVKDEQTGEERKVFGIGIKNDEKKTFLNVLGYGFKKFGAIFDSMIYTIWGLISGNISLSALSGPVGMYEVVGQALEYNIGMAIEFIIYIIAYLSINVGLINILPFPAFDGGHVLFILIEKIKGSPVNAKFENTCHLIGFILIFLLMIIVTINDIIKLF